MPRSTFYQTLQSEIDRIDAASIDKRHERIIEGFTEDPSPKAIINGQECSIFNSNDYLGLRHHPAVKSAEHQASQEFGAGPGAVRFISGSLQVHLDLEQALAKFHGRQAAMIFSSAFATNLAVLFALAKGQSRDSLVSDNVLVVSDELNHRSIIDGIRLANLPSEQRAIFKHMQPESLREILTQHLGKYQRVLVVTDGVFSMLGEYQDLKALRGVIDDFDSQYPEGVTLIVDDCHGIAAFGQTGRGTEEMTGAKADVLVGTLGKGFGADGGYVVADQVVIDYLRESAATYIYSNNISPATAGAALAAVKLVDSAEGQQLLAQSRANIAQLRELMTQAGFSFAVVSEHPIQPVLIGDPAQTKALTKGLFEAGFMVTNINFPVVPKGRDEIRVQVSAAHQSSDIEAFVSAAAKVGQTLGIV